MEEADKQPLFTCAVTVETGAEKHARCDSGFVKMRCLLSSSGYFGAK